MSFEPPTHCSTAAPERNGQSLQSHTGRGGSATAQPVSLGFCPLLCCPGHKTCLFPDERKNGATVFMANVIGRKHKALSVFHTAPCDAEPPPARPQAEPGIRPTPTGGIGTGRGRPESGAPGRRSASRPPRMISRTRQFRHGTARNGNRANGDPGFAGPSRQRRHAALYIRRRAPPAAPLSAPERERTPPSDTYPPKTKP